MVEMKWLYELLLLLYSFSLIGFMIDFIHTNRKAVRIAFWLLSMVWVIQTVFFFYHVFAEKAFPVATVIDGLYFYSWILIGLSLVIYRLYSIRSIVLFINGFAYTLMLMYMTAHADTQFPGGTIQFAQEMLIAHITLAIISYGLFTIGFFLSSMYYIQYGLLKKKQGYQWMSRFGDLQTLDVLSFKINRIGVPILLVAIILGIVWAYVSNWPFIWFDMKTIGSFIVLVMYIIFLFMRVIGYRGKGIALYNIISFLVLLINFFLSSTLSNFHY